MKTTKKSPAALFGTVLYSMDCKCRMQQPPPEQGLPEFHKCPLHSAAPELLETLKIVCLMLREAGETQEGVTFAIAEGMNQKMNDAILKAEGAKP